MLRPWVIPSVGALAAATLLPFVPVVLLAFPFDRVPGAIAGLVL
jgi:hypothetical protein